MSTDRPEPGISRRSFLVKGTLFIASAGGISACDNSFLFQKQKPPGMIAGANREAGHRLLEKPPSPDETEKAGIVIVGGGIAGLSAARELRKKGMKDFLLLELDSQTGGNAASGSNQVSPYPWGAHYIPIPGKEAVHVRELFEELGIITSYDGKGLPVYNEYYLCADPQERLFINGQWQEGLVPQFGVPDDDRRQIREFFQAMARFKKARGSDNKSAFAIPLDESSRDPRFTRYDSLSMSTYLSDNGWRSGYLRWYVNYCCRDDYGCTMDNVSAWAGIHYFASRRGLAANADPHAVVTWPEGIGWVVRKINDQVRGHIRTNACVLNVTNAGDNVAVDYLEVKRGKAVRILAKSVIYAAPRFTAFRVLEGFRKKLPAYATSFEYGPWMTANVTVRGVPGGKGADLSWDNVSCYSDSLGYVVATHQGIGISHDRTVLTYYLPLTSGPPAEERTKALKRPYQEWSEMILADLSQMHPGIKDGVERLDVWLWGHAMARPAPGFIWGQTRQKALHPVGAVYFAHSDMSGISIFEEAQYRGIFAARAVLQRFF